MTLPPAGGVPYRLVDTPGAWAAVQRRICGAQRVALDVEADGFHRYPERVALIQAKTDDDDCHILDMLAIRELGPLEAMLADPAVAKVFHACDYDVRALHRDFGFEVRGLNDTAIAAQFAGADRTGLANVLAARLGILLDKPKRLQRLDWSLRPMSTEALDYAAGDVAYLLPLLDDLTDELRSRGRDAWVVEEWQRMEDVRFEAPEPPEVAFLQVPGARELSGKGRAVLLEMFRVREEEALATGRPPYRVLANRTLLGLATEASEEREIHMPRVASGLRERLAAAIARGQVAEPVPWPRTRGRNPWDAASKRRLTLLKEWRTAAGGQLELDPGITWPLGHLKRVALAPDADVHSLDAADFPDVRRWQWRELGASLEATASAVRAGALTAGLAPMRPVSEQPASEQRSSEQPASEQQPSEQRALGQQALEQRSLEQLSLEQLSSEQQASEQQASERPASVDGAGPPPP